MGTNKTTLIHIARNSGYASLACVLPQCVVAIVCKYRLLIGIHGNHQLPAVKLATQMAVVEITACIEQRLLVVGFLHKIEKAEQRVAKLLIGQPAGALDVNHRNKILLTWQTLSHEIFKLHVLWSLGTVEMICPHHESVAVGKLYVALISGVNPVTALGSLDVNIAYIGVLTDSFPKHLALIVTYVYAMDMLAGILTLNVRILILCDSNRRKQQKYVF